MVRTIDYERTKRARIERLRARLAKNATAPSNTIAITELRDIIKGVLDLLEDEL